MDSVGELFALAERQNSIMQSKLSSLEKSHEELLSTLSAMKSRVNEREVLVETKSLQVFITNSIPYLSYTFLTSFKKVSSLEKIIKTKSRSFPTNIDKSTLFFGGACIIFCISIVFYFIK
jgi:archaellum biogenesis ATPase FlaH